MATSNSKFPYQRQPFDNSSATYDFLQDSNSHPYLQDDEDSDHAYGPQSEDLDYNISGSF